MDDDTKVYAVRGSPEDVNAVVENYAGEDGPVTMAGPGETGAAGEQWTAEYDGGSATAIYEDVNDRMYLVFDGDAPQVDDDAATELMDRLIIGRPVEPEQTQNMRYVSDALEE